MHKRESCCCCVAVAERNRWHETGAPSSFQTALLKPLFVVRLLRACDALDVSHNIKSIAISFSLLLCNFSGLFFSPLFQQFSVCSSSHWTFLEFIFLSAAWKTSLFLHVGRIFIFQWRARRDGMSLNILKCTAMLQWQKRQKWTEKSALELTQTYEKSVQI